jgi:hypothetical protein
MAPPCADTVKVAEVIVAAFIAWLKAAVRAVFTATPVVPLAGVTEVTVGGVVVNPDPEPELEPPHPETASAADTTRHAIPKRMIRVLLSFTFGNRMARPN